MKKKTKVDEYFDDLEEIDSYIQEHNSKSPTKQDLKIMKNIEQEAERIRIKEEKEHAKWIKDNTCSKCGGFIPDYD